jgi:hypothetical protein
MLILTAIAYLTNSSIFDTKDMVESLVEFEKIREAYYIEKYFLILKSTT